jgi:hypothetical protein
MANYDKHETRVPMAYPRKCSYCSTILTSETTDGGQPSYCAGRCDAERPSTNFDSEPNHIEVSIGYALGGMNYFTYKDDPRGYFLHLHPIRVRDWAVSFTMGAQGNEAGVKYLLLPARSYNRKKHAELAAKLLPHAEQLARWHFEGNRQATRDLIESLIVERKAVA